MGTVWATYWPHVVLVASIVIGIAAAVHAAMTKDDVRAAIGWVGVILLSPFLGAALYLVAGINRVRQSSVGHRRAGAERGTARVAGEAELAIPPLPDPALASMKKLGDAISAFPLTAGNTVRLLAGGDATYPAMLEAIRGAKRFIALSTYIFDNDDIGREVADALIAAKARGVQVRVLIDAVGARYSRPPITRRLEAGGVTTGLFLGNVIGFRLPYANLRSHRKMLVVDGTVALTGGMNIRAQFLTALAGENVAHDTHFRVVGPAVAQVLTVFRHDWLFATGERLSPTEWQADPDAPSPAPGPTAARIVPSGPDRNLACTHSMILGALAVAQERVRIASPYFLPDQQLIAALATAARRGLEVDIVIPSANNLRLVDYAMTAQLNQVVSVGCRVWRAGGAFDHSKLMAVDGAWAYVGSSNLDPRSLRLNFELDLEIYDRALAGEVEARIGQQMVGARAETMESLRGRPFWMRLRNRAIWLASPYL
ncbi:phospholipase D-like domain-containing protein [Ancylobacter terrae]|uniref:phospholipase D-like domain-containing protein n=1 Tax=Ancylobacter sp. sgz301288 TaxID=3342077 RepID=UPI00385F5569